MTRRAAVILAAGQGTRMKSPTPKVLHAVGGRSLVDRAIDTALALGCEKVVVVVSAGAAAVAERVIRRLGPGAAAVQDPPLGTAHAALSARSALEGFDGDLLITNGDHPLQDADAIAPLFEARQAGADLAVLGFEATDPGAYGRMILGPAHRLIRIVEAKDALPDDLEVRICNANSMVASAKLMLELLSDVRNDNAQKEYYLTDVVGLATHRSLRVQAALAPEDSVMGVNSQAELAAAEAAFQRRRRAQLMAEGVTMPAPDTVQLSWDTEIAAGVTVEPYVVFAPGVKVESGAVIRAFCHLEDAVVRSGAIIGPYARLRPGADIGEDAHIGNFVEVKKVRVGRGAKANHLSYLGDGSVGEKANIGAGTIFCNYDGFDKFETHVGANAFIGSDTALVAPVTVGEGAFTGSGSVITQDVSPNALALGRGRQVEKPGWAAEFRSKKQAARKARQSVSKEAAK
jgi:bifunctional UDP-N-acetylglucosamine pyrophosphorylase/glucosamine-1-phosphate N-acetyltransferase